LRRHHKGTDVAAIATDGLTHSSWADLLFSPRAAWLFDASAGQFLWGSPSARERFGADLAGFAERLPRSTMKRLLSISRFKRRPLIVTEPLVLGHGGESLPCRIEALSLADGSTGLIIRDARGEPAGPAGLAQRQSAPPKPAPRASTPVRGAVARDGAASPRLSPEDEQALRAIGRRVRRLCRAKQAERNEPQAARAAMARPAKAAGSRDAAQCPELDARILQAFDAFAELDGQGRITSLSGRLCRAAGWSARDSTGLPLMAFAQGKDRSRIEALIARLQREPGRVASADLLFRANSGAPLACRVVAAVRCGDGRADPAMWAAIISLKTSRRMLRNLAEKPVPAMPAKRAA
jgi:PAS domain-containing protein